MAVINPDEISSILKENIRNYEAKAEVSNVGSVLEVGDGICRIYGLRNVMSNELVEFEDGKGTLGITLNLEEDNVGVVILGEYTHIKEGMSVMAWEVMAVAALVLMAMWFLPKFLKTGVTTVPEYLKLRFDGVTGGICNLIFLLTYILFLLPIILYTGARGMIDILNLGPVLGVQSEAPCRILLLNRHKSSVG